MAKRRRPCLYNVTQVFSCETLKIRLNPVSTGFEGPRPELCSLTTNALPTGRPTRRVTSRSGLMVARHFIVGTTGGSDHQKLEVERSR